MNLEIEATSSSVAAAFTLHFKGVNVSGDSMAGLIYIFVFAAIAVLATDYR
jgi:hypothetical protein